MKVPFKNRFKESMVIPSKDGASYKRVMVDPTDRDVAIVEKVEQYFYKGKYGTRRYTWKQEIKGRTISGSIELGPLITGTTRFQGFVEYKNSGTSRIDNGFSSLMESFKIAGMAGHAIMRINRKWDMLSDQQKSRVFNTYRTNTFEKGYGSDAYDPRAVMSFDNDMEYAEILENAIDDELGIPIEERSYDYI